MEKEQFLSKEEKARIAELLLRIREISRNFEITIGQDLTFKSPFIESCFYNTWVMQLHGDLIEIGNILTVQEGGEA